MNAKKPLVVKAIWDEEAQVWVATSDEVPGLVTEAPSRDALVKKLKVMIPELLDYSPHTRRSFTVDGDIKSRHTANAIMKQAGIDHHF